MTPVIMKMLLRNAFRRRTHFNICLYLSTVKEKYPGMVTIQEVKKNLMDVMGISLGYSPLQTSRDYLLKYLPKTQDDLPIRTMQDSFREAYIPLEDDLVLQEKYVTFLGHLRIGRLMEDMDMFAVWVADKHIKNPYHEAGVPSPYVLVTVLVEKISFSDIVPKSNADIRLSGHVSYVGRSSMEIVVWMEQMHSGNWKKLTRAIFLMAARNSNNSASAPVNRLEAVSDYEKEILAGGKDRNSRRKRIRSESLLKQIPDECEQQVIHNTFLETLDLSNPTFERQTLPPDSAWMKSAKLENIIFCQPEDRNLHNKVFGGFLMRNALELSWMKAYLYSKCRPKLLHIADISFIKPVDVGSLLNMQACVTYTEHNFGIILVLAQILDPYGNLSTTNNFHFIYHFPEKIKRIVPKSYAEAMLYIDGRRKFQHIMNLSGPNNQ